jgi:hypothetical protein
VVSFLDEQRGGRTQVTCTALKWSHLDVGTVVGET